MNPVAALALQTVEVAYPQRDVRMREGTRPKRVAGARPDPNSRVPPEPPDGVPDGVPDPSAAEPGVEDSARDEER